MGKYGWSYPPGCSGTPCDEVPDPSPLQEEILGILERNEVPQEVNDRITKILEEWELSQLPPELEPEF